MMSSGMTLERLQVVMEANTKKFNEEIKNVQKQVKDMSDSVNSQVGKVKSAISSITKSVAGLYALSKVGQYIKNSVQSAMQVEASLQQVARTMGESTQSFLKWAETSALSFNMAQSDALKFGATYSNLVSSFLSDTGQITGATTELLKASSVIASATGRTMDDVMERIRSGLLGNTEAIEDLGVNVNVALLETTEAFKRLANGKSWNQLSFQTQQQIRLMAILEQTSSKFGNEVFQNTNSSLQQLVAILKDVALNLGNAFLPIANVVIPLLSKMAMWLRTVTSYFATFMQTLFGYSPKANAGISGTATSSTSAVNSLGDSLDSAGTSADTTKKKLQNLLGGFDEINTLSLDDGSSSTSGTGSSSGTGGVGVGSGLDFGNIGSFDFEEPDTSKVEAWVAKFKDLFKPLIESWENVKIALQPIIETVGSALRWFYDNVLLPLGTWTISSLIPAFFDLLAGVLTVLDPILKSFQPSFQWLWDNALQPIATWTGGIIVSVLENLAVVLTTIGDWMSSHQSIIDGITTSILLFFAAWKVTELLSFIQTSGGIIGALSAIKNAIVSCTLAKLTDKAETIALTVMYAKDFVVSLAKGTAALVKQAAQWTVNTALKIADTTAQIAMTAATTAWNVVCGVATTVTTAFGAAVAFLTSPIGLVITAIAALVTAIVLLVKNWDTVKDVASKVWSSVKTTWNSASSWFNTKVVTPIKNFFTGMWDKVKETASSTWKWITNLFAKGGQIFSGITEGIVSAFKSIVNALISGINKIIATPFNTINGLLNKIRSIEVLGIQPFSGMWSVNPLPVPQIPKLARGGIVDAATIFMAGEAGKEVVMPLENNTGWMTEVANRIASQLPQQSSSNSDQPFNIIFQVGSTTLGKLAIEGINAVQRQAGTTLIKKI